MATSLTRGAHRRSDWVVLLAAGILALIAAILVFVALDQKTGTSTVESTTPVAGTVGVVTAAEDIAANTTLSADMLKVSDLPSTAALAGTFSAADLLVGQVTRYPLSQGEQLTSSKVGTSVSDDKSISLVVAPGYRAISIPVQEENMVGGLVLPGDIVDVIAVFDSQDTGTPKAATLLQNVAVVAVGQEAEKALPVPSVAPAGSAGVSGLIGQPPDNVKAQFDATTVTLSVKPEQAELLALSAENTKLWLSLRARGDSANVDLSGTDLSAYGLVSQ